MAYPAPRTPNFKVALNFFWLTLEGRAAAAPNAQLILYPDYPEVRLSGVLLGCREAPSALMNNRQPGRLLFLGICDDGRIIAHVAPHDSPLTQELINLGDLETSGVFRILPPLQIAAAGDTKDALLRELGRIYRLGWIASQRLDGHGLILPYAAQNGGGYTLEAELKITPNGISEPDYLGWEVKQYRVPNIALPERGQIITLMTPEPNGGLYHSDFYRFMQTYGYADQRIADRLNFGGVHFVGRRHPKTQLLLELRGYDFTTNKITDVNGGLHLVDTQGDSAASWNFTGLLNHWGRKHNQAVYVPCQSEAQNAKKHYRYGDVVRLGEGTEATLFVRALADALVYYDPAPKIEAVSSARPKVKKRNQFRIKFRHLEPLYHKFMPASVIQDV